MKMRGGRGFGRGFKRGVPIRPIPLVGRPVRPFIPIRRGPFLRPYWGFGWGFWPIRAFMFDTYAILALQEAAMLYKLNQWDVKRIEAETGKPVEQLSEAELVAAIKRMGINKLEVTPDDHIKLQEQGFQGFQRVPEQVQTANKEIGRLFCTQCGASVSPDSIYCEQCGAKLD
jgi:zinc-ribbon domain